MKKMLGITRVSTKRRIDQLVNAVVHPYAAVKTAVQRRYSMFPVDLGDSETGSLITFNKGPKTL